MLTRRSLIKNSGAAAFGAMALTAVTSGTGVADAVAAGHPNTPWTPMPDPSASHVPNPPYPAGLTSTERHHLKTFDELDFDVFSNQKWARLHESHARHIRAHWPDGHYTDGIEKHISDLKFLFSFAPDTRVKSHYLRVATGNLTAVAGVMKGTFSAPMPDGKGGLIQPTGKKYAINMATVGIWNKRGQLDEEFLFWDNQAFYQQMGLG